MSNYKGPYNSFSQNAEPIYNQSNILGTVSQSGGVPTGAIIERGSNSDGEYVVFADGTMIMQNTVTVDSGVTSVTIPFAFTPIPTSAMPRAGGYATFQTTSGSLGFRQNAIVSQPSGLRGVVVSSSVATDSTFEIYATKIGRRF